MPDDGQGLLTERQRAYLSGESGIKPKSSHERAIRSRIRTRLYNSIFDLALLYDTLEPRDVEQAFRNDKGSLAFYSASQKGTPTKRVESQFGKVLALIFDGAARTGPFQDYQMGFEDHDTEDIVEIFSSIVEEGVTEVFLRRGVTVNDVTVNMAVELGPRFSDVATDDLSALTETQLKRLLEDDTISPEEYGREIKRRQDA